MVEVNVQEAKAQLTRLLLRVIAGEEIVISQAGQAIARLVPVSRQSLPRPLGIDRGLFNVPDNFNDPLPEDLLLAFEGRG